MSSSFGAHVDEVNNFIAAQDKPTLFELALLGGIFAGVVSSFMLMKFFTFRSHVWSRASGELVRFLIVYLAGLVFTMALPTFSVGIFSLPSYPCAWPR